jgi:hypothetical protein
VNFIDAILNYRPHPEFGHSGRVIANPETALLPDLAKTGLVFRRVR